MTDVINALNKAVYSKLTGGTALTALLSSTTAIYHAQAPEGTTMPYVVWNVQAGGDENLSPIRSQNIVMFVRAYAATSSAGAGTIDAQIDALLHEGTLSLTGWTNIWMARESVFTSVEPLPTGGYIYMAGGYYRIILNE